MLRFKNDYSNAQSRLKSHQILLKDTLKSLRIIVGDESFEGISDLEFYYAEAIDMDSYINNSIYNEILDLNAQDYEQSAKVISRSMVNGMQIGAGYTIVANSIDLKFIIPLPFTSQANYQQQALLELQSASVREKQITQAQIKQNAYSYQEQLKEQEEVIALHSQNQENAKNLFDIMQKGFDSGVISVFEYLDTKNNYLDSRINLTQEKLNYIRTLSLLEESLGVEINTKETK